jgi:hypothetical protein
MSSAQGIMLIHTADEAHLIGGASSPDRFLAAERPDPVDKKIGIVYNPARSSIWLAQRGQHGADQIHPQLSRR